MVRVFVPAHVHLRVHRHRRHGIDVHVLAVVCVYMCVCKDICVCIRVCTWLCVC